MASITLMIMVCWPVCAQTSLANKSGCGDFLTQMGKKPARLIYISCDYFPDEQGKPLRAIYHVSGSFAGNTEKQLIKSVGLNRLTRSCCQWDSPMHQFRDETGKEFSITMVSEETAVATRVAWREILTFEVIVETFTENI